MTNYYHWTAEGATRLLLSMDYFLGEHGAAPDARLLIPAGTENGHILEFLKTFGLSAAFAAEPILYEPDVDKRYLFDTLHRVDWVQLDSSLDDLWSDYLPSRAALTRLRDAAREHQAAIPASQKETYGGIVYIVRHGVREVQNEQVLLDMLKDAFGDNLEIHDGGKRLSTGQPAMTLQRQLDMMENAKVIMGAHGAGLVNAIYAPDDVTLVEFPMKPQCNRCFGYIAAAFEMDYWMVPEVHCFYHVKYVMSKRKAKAVLATLRAILEQRGLMHLYVDGYEQPDRDEL